MLSERVIEMEALGYALLLICCALFLTACGGNQPNSPTEESHDYEHPEDDTATDTPAPAPTARDIHRVEITHMVETAQHEARIPRNTRIDPKYRHTPFDGDRLGELAKYLNLSEDETALMFDLAGRENRAVPYDIQDTFMYEEVGDLARYALRQSKAGHIKEADWKAFIRAAESKRAKGNTESFGQGGATDG